MVAHSCNPSTQETKRTAVNSRPARATHQDPHSTASTPISNFQAEETDSSAGRALASGPQNLNKNWIQCPCMPNTQLGDRRWSPENHRKLVGWPTWLTSERDKETLSKQGERWTCVLRPSLTAATHIGFHRLPTSLDQSAEKCLTSNLKLGANQSKPARPCLSKSKKIIKYLK